MSLKKEGPIRRFLAERETLIPRKKLFHHSPQVTPLKIDRKLESMREAKKSEWLAKGYSPALVEKALKLADTWGWGMAKGLLPGMPEAQEVLVRSTYPKALETAEHWLETMAK